MVRPKFPGPKMEICLLRETSRNLKRTGTQQSHLLRFLPYIQIQNPVSNEFENRIKTVLDNADEKFLHILVTKLDANSRDVSALLYGKVLDQWFEIFKEALFFKITMIEKVPAKTRCLITALKMQENTSTDFTYYAFGKAHGSNRMLELLQLNNFTVEVSLWMYLQPPTAPIPSDGGFVKLSDANDAMSINRKLLAYKIATDVELIDNVGGSHPCHKSFLCVHSDVFAAMLTIEMEESKTNRILTDISPECVTAFLSYLYTWDVEMPSKQVKMAIEMFQVGHKYGISCLEKKMAEILQKCQSCLFTVDEAFQLYYFVRNLDDHVNLQEKAVMILKKKHGELETSVEYRTLLRRNSPESMKIITEIFKLILSCWNADKPGS